MEEAIEADFVIETQQPAGKGDGKRHAKRIKLCSVWHFTYGQMVLCTIIIPRIIPDLQCIVIDFILIARNIFRII